MFTINNNGELNINGEFTNAHFGERRLTIVASDQGNPPQENRAYIIVNIQGSNTQQQLFNNVDQSKYSLTSLSDLNGDKKNHEKILDSSSYSKTFSNENINQFNGVSALFSRATLPNLFSSSKYLNNLYF